jgi:hypothetical protein
MLDKVEFCSVLLALGEMYDKKVTEVVTGLYYETLKEYDIDQVKTAVSKVIKNHVYNTLPKPAEILQYLEGSADDRAMIAWLKAKKAVQICGYTHDPVFDDNIISHCIIHICGSWVNFCSISTEELPYYEKRFLDAYRVFERKGVAGPANLIGFINRTNSDKFPDYMVNPVAIEEGKTKKQGEIQ